MNSIHSFVASYEFQDDFASIEQKLWNERYSNQPTRLHCNETPFDLPIKLKEQLATKMVQMDWNRYPDFYNTELTKIVAQNIGFQAENILLGNGSSQLIQQIVNGAATFLSGAIIEHPTFTFYHQACQNAQIPYQEWALTENGNYDLTTFPQVSDPSLVILTSPNNPTGAILPLATLQTLLESHPYCIFVVDEAYGEFGGESALHLVHKYNNLLVLKTLSKGYGLPSIRFGYVVGSPLFIESLRKHTIPFTINIFTELIVREFLTNPDFMKVLKANQERIINLRHFVFHLLNDMAEANESFSVQPSAANFLLLRFKDTELLDNIKKVLDEQHILISYPLPQCLRLTIGTEVEMCQLIRLVRRSLSQYRQYEGKGIKKLSA